MDFSEERILKFKALAELAGDDTGLFENDEYDSSLNLYYYTLNGAGYNGAVNRDFRTGDYYTGAHYSKYSKKLVKLKTPIPIPSKDVKDLPKEARGVVKVEDFFVGDQSFNSLLDLGFDDKVERPLEKLAIMAGKALPIATRSNALQRPDEPIPNWSWNAGVFEEAPPNLLPDGAAPFLQPPVVQSSALQPYVEPANVAANRRLNVGIQFLFERLQALQNEAVEEYNRTRNLGYQDLANIIYEEAMRISAETDLASIEEQLRSLLLLAERAMESVANRPREIRMRPAPGAARREEFQEARPETLEQPAAPATPAREEPAPGAPRKKSTTRRERVGYQPTVRELFQGVQRETFERPIEPAPSRIPVRRPPPRITQKVETPNVSAAAPAPPNAPIQSIPRVISESGARDLTPEEVRARERVSNEPTGEIVVPAPIKAIRNAIERNRVANRYKLLVKSTESRFDDNLYVEKALLKHVKKVDEAMKRLVDEAALISDILNVVRFIKNKESNTFYLRTFFNVPNQVAEQYLRNNSFNTRR